MQDVQWGKYDDATLDFVFSESKSLQQETLNSFRESINRSYGAIVFFGTMLAFCLEKLISNEFSKELLPYFIAIAGLSVCIGVVWNNLLPGKMNIYGTKPDRLLNDYFSQDDFKESRKRQMMIVRIDDMNTAISQNISQVILRSQRFRTASSIFIVTFVFCICSWLLG